MPSHRWIFGILLVAFCASLLMATFTTAKRIATERPNPSLKLKQSKSTTRPQPSPHTARLSISD